MIVAISRSYPSLHSTAHLMPAIRDLVICAFIAHQSYDEKEVKSSRVCNQKAVSRKHETVYVTATDAGSAEIRIIPG